MKKSTRVVAFGGVLLALSIVTLFLAAFIPGVELTLFAIASFFVAFIIIETDIKGGWIFYLASTILSVMLIPNKFAILPYAMFFGLYGIAKFYIEKIKKQPIEIILKLIFFNIMCVTGLYIFKDAFLGNIAIPDVTLPIIIVGAEVAFLFYDYLFTLGLVFYLKRKPKHW